MGIVTAGFRATLVAGVVHAGTANSTVRWLRSEDRRLLEDVIFSHFALRAQFNNILFVGCAWYTAHYSRFFKSRNYWTMDPDPGKKIFGAKQHVVDTLQQLDQYFSPGQLDLIVCNGVFGWGLDRLADCQAAFENCYTCLRDDGEFILGWNNVPDHAPIAVDQIDSLTKFQVRFFPPLAAWCYTAATSNRHTYNFYVKSGNPQQGLRAK